MIPMSSLAQSGRMELETGTRTGWHQKDLSTAIREVNEQIKILQTTESETKESAGDNRAVKELQDRIQL